MVPLFSVGRGGEAGTTLGDCVNPGNGYFVTVDERPTVGFLPVTSHRVPSWLLFTSRRRTCLGTHTPKVPLGALLLYYRVSDTVNF